MPLDVKLVTFLQNIQWRSCIFGTVGGCLMTVVFTISVLMIAEPHIQSTGADTKQGKPGLNVPFSEMQRNSGNDIFLLDFHWIKRYVRGWK